MVRTVVALLICVGLVACNASSSPPLCSNQWFLMVEEQLGTGDGAGHGPDVGSEEWQSVVEFRLKVRGQPEVPERNTQQWCEYVQGLL